MSELKAKQRNNLNDNIFGIPELRKYPLNDKEHVVKAIQMFHHCPIKYKKSLASKIYFKADEYNIKLNKDSPIYEYLPKHLQENYEYNFLIEGLEDEFFEFINEAYMNEIEAQEKVDTAIQMWRDRMKMVKTAPDKNQLMIEARTERAAIATCMKNGDSLGIIKRAAASTSKLRTFMSRANAKFDAKSATSKSAIGEVGNKVASGAVTAARVPGAVAKGLAQGLAPGVKAGITVGAMAVGAKAGRNINRGVQNFRNQNEGFVKKNGARAAGAALAGAVAVSALTMNQRRSVQDDGIKKQSSKYVEFCNQLPSEVEKINISATSGAIQPDRNEQKMPLNRPKG